jgi:hypothetical protein
MLLEVMVDYDPRKALGKKSRYTNLTVCSININAADQCWLAFNNTYRQTSKF